MIGAKPAELTIDFNSKALRAFEQDRKTIMCFPVWPQPSHDTECPYHRKGVARSCPAGMPGHIRPVKGSKALLRIKNTRIIRLQTLTPEDALACGMRLRGDSNAAPFNAIQDFIHHWNMNFGDHEQMRWVDNPWVWVIDFEKVE